MLISRKMVGYIDLLLAVISRIYMVYIQHMDIQGICCVHYNDDKMGAMASQITSLTIVYSIVYSGADQRKHQSSVSLAFVRFTGEFPAQMASNTENVSICRRHHGLLLHPCNIHYLYIDSPYWWMPDVSLIYNSVFSRRRVCWCWLIAPSVNETWDFLSTYRVNYSSIFVLLNNTDFVNDTTPGMLLFYLLTYGLDLICCWKGRNNSLRPWVD